MIEKLKAMWRADPGAYEWGLLRGSTITAALMVAALCADDDRLVLAAVWLFTAAVLASGVPRERRRAERDSGNEATWRAERERDRWKRAANECLVRIEELEAELREQRARGYL